jgi:hypothetical protein
MAKIPYFTMKHCAHWNGPFEGRREDPEKRGARNRRDLHRPTEQVTTKVTFRLEDVKKSIFKFAVNSAFKKSL